MRRKAFLNLMLVFILSLPFPVGLEAALKVYRIDGSVKIKRPSGLTPLQRRDNVTASDLLVISNGGKVDIFDSDTRRIFSSTGIGSMTVENLIANADVDASEVTRATNRKVLDAVRNNGRAEKDKFGGKGVSRHETDANINGLIALPEGVTYLSYLMSLSPDDDYDDYNDIVLMRRNFPDSDDSFNFAVFNTLEDPLYFNIIDQRTDGDITMYFPVNPIAGPRGATVVEEYRFLDPEDSHGYIVVASDKDFTADDIRRLLDSSCSPVSNFYFSLLRI